MALLRCVRLGGGPGGFRLSSPTRGAPREAVGTFQRMRSANTKKVDARLVTAFDEA